MNLDQLTKVAEAMVQPGKGILAADESSATIKKRFDVIGVDSTADNRRDYRELLFRSSEDSMPTASNRFPIVPKLSSAARMPFPGATSSLAVFSSSCRFTLAPLVGLCHNVEIQRRPRTAARGPRPLCAFCGRAL